MTTVIEELEGGLKELDTLVEKQLEIVQSTSASTLPDATLSLVKLLTMRVTANSILEMVKERS